MITQVIKAIVKVLMGLFMVFAGFSHLTVAREEFVAQVPVWIQFSPGFTDFVVLASGVVEILLGLCMLCLWKGRSGWAGAALGENGENGVMYYLADATATFFKMMEPVETITF